MAAIIFDFDGTIANSFDYVVDFLADEKGLARLDHERREELRDLSMAAIARELGFKWWRMPKLFFAGRSRMQHSVKHLKPFAGIPELLEKLHAEGHQLFIISTNSLANVHSFLHHYDLHKYFLEVYGGVGLFSKTPALKRLFKEQSLSRKECIYIGDEVRDIQAAQAAQTRVIAVDWGFANAKSLRAKRPTAIAETPAELLALLENV